MVIKPYYSIVGGSLLKNKNLKGKYYYLEPFQFQNKKLYFKTGCAHNQCTRHCAIPRADYENEYCHWAGNKKALESKSCTLQTSSEINWLDFSKATGSVITKELFVKSPHYTPTHIFLTEAVTPRCILPPSIGKRPPLQAGDPSASRCFPPLCLSWRRQNVCSPLTIPGTQAGLSFSFSPHGKKS